jgi:hypothetical protein
MRLYYTFLSIFIFRAVWQFFPTKGDPSSWFLLFHQELTTQWWFWRLLVLAIEMTLFFCMLEIIRNPSERNVKMIQTLILIQLWYIVEYLFHYTSVWISYHDLLTWGFKLGPDDRYSGFSSHIVTMIIFAWRCYG